jgi:tankyrase
MATKKQGSHASFLSESECFEGGRELFEACRNGDVNKVRRLVSANANVNARDTAGRKSSPLHFAAGKVVLKLNPSTKF